MVFLLTENRKQTRVMKYMTNQPKQCTILQGTSLKTGPQTLGTKFDSSQNPSRSKTPAKPLGVFFRRKWMQQANKEGTQTKKKLYQVLQMFFKIISFGRTRNLHFGNQVGSLWRSWWHESGNRSYLATFLSRVLRSLKGEYVRGDCDFGPCSCLLWDVNFDFKMFIQFRNEQNSGSLFTWRLKTTKWSPGIVDCKPLPKNHGLFGFKVIQTILGGSSQLASS